MARVFGLFLAIAFIAPLEAASLPSLEVDHAAAAKYDFSALRARLVALLPIKGRGDAIRLGDGGALGTYVWLDRDLELIGGFFAQETLADISALSSHEVPDLVREAVERVR